MQELIEVWYKKDREIKVEVWDRVEEVKEGRRLDQKVVGIAWEKVS